MNIRWLKSSFSEQGDNNCLELASHGADMLIRESDRPDVIVMTASVRIGALLEDIKAGVFERL